ncbi:MAG TPA: LysR substrate-binding domain-containing protein, partial [Candidatus Binatus sp.]|nr:LysR substrate-binding domain-containing protein [Candidatus Binatus sp.]HSV08349.1 LysR substrate-binding domain-containing protein [Candidatus Binatus sp.]
PRTVAALAEHECVLFQSSSGQAVWKLVGPRGAETVEVRGAISADDHHMVREAAAAGQGLALLPIVACAGRDDASELRRVLPRHAAEGPPLHLVYPSARLVPKRVALLRDQILQEMPQRLKP